MKSYTINRSRQGVNLFNPATLGDSVSVRVAPRTSGTRSHRREKLQEFTESLCERGGMGFTPSRDPGVCVFFVFCFSWVVYAGNFANKPKTKE